MPCVTRPYTLYGLVIVILPCAINNMKPALQSFTTKSASCWEILRVNEKSSKMLDGI